MHDVSRMDRDRIGSRGGVAIGFGLGSASGQQTPQGVDFQVLGTVAAGEDCPGHVLRMRRITFAPGASIPMHSHKDRPEVALVIQGTLTNRLKGQSPTQLAVSTAILGGRASTRQRDQQTRRGPWRGPD
jgi:hypothetical protein